MRNARSLRLGILTNEVLEPSISRTGGFGYAATGAARFFVSRPELRVQPLILACEALAIPESGMVRLDGGIDLLPHHRDREQWSALLAKAAPDLLLAIDYRPTYDAVFEALPATPAIVWVRDPRTWTDYGRVAGVRLPGTTQPVATGLGPGPVRGFRRILLRSIIRRRRIRLCPTTPFLRSKIRGCYGVPPWRTPVLPNIIPPARPPIVKSATPQVLVLGRLDPIKRPWIALEVARRLPDISFVFLGRNHFPNLWTPGELPPNVTVAGHLDGVGKQQHLNQSWLLLNTSVHEGLAVSFLEALAYETPIVSLLDPEGVASRFGHFAGTFEGDGMEAVQPLADAIRRLITHPDELSALGRAGRQWVQATHSEETFLASFSALRRQLGVWS